MYRATTSFATNTYDVRQNQILEDDFTTEAEIQEFLEIGYIEVYTGEPIVLLDGMKLSRSTVEILNNLDTSNVTDMSNFFNQCTNLVTVDNLNTSNVTTMVSMFNSCSKIKNIPVMDASKVTDMKDMFRYAGAPSHESLNNILATCASTTEAYTKTKTLRYLSFSSAQATTCEGLSNFQAFLDAGWTTGY